MFTRRNFVILYVTTHHVAECMRVEIQAGSSLGASHRTHDQVPFNMNESTPIQAQVHMQWLEKDPALEGSSSLYQYTDVDVKDDMIGPKTAPGQEAVTPCLSTAWTDFLKMESPRCFDQQMVAGGASRKTSPKCQPGPSRGLRDKGCPLSPGPNQDDLAGTLSSWNESLTMPFPMPFDIMLGKFETRAQAWETAYLAKAWKGPDTIKPNPSAHWYELELNPEGVHPNSDHSGWYNKKVDNTLKIPSLGRLFGTRIPRNLGAALRASYGQESSDVFSFKAHMDVIDSQGGNNPSPANWLVVPLIIDKDLKDAQKTLGFEGHDEVNLPEASSAALWNYYKHLGITTLQCPFNDFAVPHIRAATECIERITIHLARGGNVIIHCFGGTGRTGTMLMSVAKTLGVPDVLGWGRRIGGPGKGSWVETHEQELFVDQLPRIMTQHMAASITQAVQNTIDARFARQLSSKPVWKKSNIRVAECSDGRKIVMQDRCQHWRNCRTCWGNPPVNDLIPLTDQGAESYDYLAAEVPYFKPRCTEPDGRRC